jgi:O-antigen ligase
VNTAHFPRLLLLWIALVGLAIPEDLTFGARTSASDYVLPFLMLSAMVLAHRLKKPFIPPRARMWMFLAVWWSAIALVHGTLRAGHMKLEVILSTVLALVIGYCIVCAAYAVLSGIESIQQAITIFVVVGSLWNLASLVHHVVSGGWRLSGTLLNPNAYAMFISTVWVCQIAYLAMAKNSRLRLIQVSNLLLLTVGLVLSGSRGAWGGCLLVLALIFGFSRVRTWGYVLLSGVALVGAVWALFPWLEAQGWLAPVLERANLDRGVNSRLLTETLALRLWASNPLTMLIGTGTGLYSVLYGRFISGAADSIHNIYVLYLVEQGPLGLAIWLAIFVVAVRSLLRSRHSVPVQQRWLINAVALVILVLLVQGVTHDISNQRSLWLFTGLALAIGDSFLGAGAADTVQAKAPPDVETGSEEAKAGQRNTTG